MIEPSSSVSFRSLRQWISLTLLAVTVAFLGGCATTSSTSSGTYHVDAYAPTNPSKVQVLVSLKAEIVYVMEGDKCLMATPTTVGVPGHETPTGHFTVYNKNATKRSGEYGFWTNGSDTRPGDANQSPGAGWKYIGYPMANWVEFSPGFGFHEGYVWPVPRSHGCLRLHKNAAGKFFKLVQIGTPVYIAQTQPEDATIGAHIAHPTDYKDPDPPAQQLTSPEYFNQPRETDLIPAAAQK